MSAIDWRVAVDVGPWGMVGLTVEDPRAERPISLDVSSLHIQLDYAEAGELFDRLAQALGLVVAAHGSPAAGAAAAAIIGLEAAHQAPVHEPADTPTDEGMPGAV